MPKQDFIDRAEQDEFAVEAKKQIEAETARSYNAPAKAAPTYAKPAPTYANPAPTYAQRQHTLNQRQHTLNQRQHTLNQRQHTLNQHQHRRIHIHMVVEFTLLHHHRRRQWQNPVPVPLYYQQPATYRAPAPQQDTTVTNAPVLLHH